LISSSSCSPPPESPPYASATKGNVFGSCKFILSRFQANKRCKAKISLKPNILSCFMSIVALL
jgi:hypothetical protein